MEYTHTEKEKEILNGHIDMLSLLARVSNSGITLFDSKVGQHLYTSFNFRDILGYDLNAIESEGNAYFNKRIHPDDILVLEKNGEYVYGLINNGLISIDDYKLINEYRVLNKDGFYVRVIEQHQVIERDVDGSLWLSLGVMDISPDQNEFNGVKSQILNYKTGEIFSVQNFMEEHEDNPLSTRETEVLRMVGKGLSSKDISAKLFISVHTVNTHRQRILEKLNASNSLEAVKYASGLGLI